MPPQTQTRAQARSASYSDAAQGKPCLAARTSCASPRLHAPRENTCASNGSSTPLHVHVPPARCESRRSRCGGMNVHSALGREREAPVALVEEARRGDARLVHAAEV